MSIALEIGRVQVKSPLAKSCGEKAKTKNLEPIFLFSDGVGGFWSPFALVLEDPNPLCGRSKHLKIESIVHPTE